MCLDFGKDISYKNMGFNSKGKNIHSYIIIIIFAVSGELSDKCATVIYVWNKELYINVR